MLLTSSTVMSSTMACVYIFSQDARFISCDRTNPLRTRIASLLAVNTDALHLNSVWAVTRVIYGYALRSYDQLQFQLQFEKAQNGGDDVTAVYCGRLQSVLLFPRLLNPRLTATLCSPRSSAAGGCQSSARDCSQKLRGQLFCLRDIQDKTISSAECYPSTNCVKLRARRHEQRCISARAEI
jgi:hypothetical protein